MTRKITPAQLDEIEAAAKEATPGPWEVIPATFEEGRRIKTPAYELMGVDIDAPYLDITDAEHIAMMDPATTLALIAEVRELRAKVERVEAIHRPIRAVLYPGTSERVMEVCAECRTSFGDWRPWPCPTIRALDAN